MNYLQPIMEATRNHNTSEEQQELFLNALFQATRHDVELRVISKDGIVVDQHFSRDHKKIKQIIKRHSLTHNIYFGVFTREGNQGKAENVREGTCIFADMDFKNYKGGQKEADEIIKKFPVKPSLVIHTGNGYHLYWLLAKVISVQNLKDRVINILRGIANTLSADTSVADIARVLRMPGTLNHKTIPPKPVFLDCINEIRYSLEDFRDYETLEQTQKKTPLRELYQGVPDGQRNVSLTRLIGSLVNDGLSYDECLAFAFQWNENNNPPETDLKKIERTVKSVYETHYRNKPQEDHKLLISYLLKWNDILSLNVKTEYLLDKLIPQGSITLLFGRGGIGKTSICLQIARAEAEGIPFGELKTIKTPTYYIDFENPLAILKERVEKIGLSENLYVWHISNEKQPPRLDTKEWELYKQLPPGLLIFDTLRAAHLSDENDSRPMALIMTRLKELREMGFTILLLHHTPKGNENIFKGSTALLDLADHVLGLEEVREPDTIEFDTENLYRLGARIKTRYDPYHIFLKFNPDIKGFEVVNDPALEKIEAIYEILKEFPEGLKQKEFKEKVKNELDLTESQIRKLLKKGEGLAWDVKKGGEKNRALIYTPKSNRIIGQPIYSHPINQLKTQADKDPSNNMTSDSMQSLDNTESDNRTDIVYPINQLPEKQDNEPILIDTEVE